MDEAGPYRVIQWGTGQVGTYALAGIIDDPRLDLVGVKVYSEEKEGRDAGELCGRGPVGLTATRDVDPLLALDADCVFFSATDMFGVDEVFDDLCRILRSGKNVVSVTVTKLVFPPSIPEVAARLEAACQEGGSSYYYGGINPDVAPVVLPALLTSGCRDVEFIRTTGYFDISTYVDPLMLRGMGMGLTPEEDKATAQFSIDMMGNWFTPSLRALSDALHGGPQAEPQVRVTRDTVLAKEEFDVAACHVAPGTICGCHFAVEHFIADKPRLAYHAYYRISAPGEPWPDDWPAPPGGLGGYRTEVHGLPTMKLDWTFDTPGTDPLIDCVIFPATRLVNAIPVVCEAPPGVHNSFTLPRSVIGRVNWGA